MWTFEIINTGTELLLGRTLNTHHQWLARHLYDLGFNPIRQTTVADTGSVIESVVREALGRADLILVTGGLGPTSDDLTRDKIAELLGRRLILDTTVLDQIRQFYETRLRRTPETTQVQAQVPEGAEVIMNRNGTAPGLVIEVKPNPFRPDGTASLLVLLPGPPRELKPMFIDQVLPRLKERFPALTKHAGVTLRTTGMGESQIEETLAPRICGLLKEGLDVGYCAQMGQVELRLSAHGAQAQSLVDRAEAITRLVLGSAVFGIANDTLESVVIQLLTLRQQTVALAESCTGGFIGHRLTNVPGASSVFLASLVTYSNDAKTKLLGVRPETLADHGAASEPVACEMAAGARQLLGSDFAVSVTGIAGPTGGTTEKPTGTVFIGLAFRDKVTAIRRYNPVDRETFKWMTSQQALDLLRQALT